MPDDPDAEAEACRAQAADALASYVPDLASPEHAPLIRELAALYRPANRTAASKIAGQLSGYVYWCEQQGLDVDRDLLLDPDTIDAYVERGLARMADGTRTTARTALRRVVRGDRGRLDRPVREPADPLRPYTRDETDAIIGWAAGQPSEPRRRATLAVACLGLGSGLAAADVREVTGTDVTTLDDGTVLVDVRGKRPRRVPVLSRYERALIDCAAVAGPGWIANPSVDPAGRERAEVVLQAQFAAAQRPTGSPPRTLTRARVPPPRREHPARRRRRSGRHDRRAGRQVRPLPPAGPGRNRPGPAPARLIA